MANTKRDEKTTITEGNAQVEVEKKSDAAQDVSVSEEAVAREKLWIVRVQNNPEYCGVGAGGTQFARGEAIVRSERMAQWFREHRGYAVIEQ